MENCASCHGPHLNDGQFAPAVKGAAFKSHWHDQSLEALRTLIIKRMPPASPGSLGSQTYADIDAYLLQENGDQAGTTELAAGSASALAAAPAEALPRPSTMRYHGTVGASLGENLDEHYHAVMAARKALLDKLTPVSDAMLRSPLRPIG